jgi:hypothetical protein
VLAKIVSVSNSILAMIRWWPITRMRRCGGQSCHCGSAEEMMTLFIDPTGPKLTYENGMLHVADLNPQIETRWRMTRWDMFKLGWRCIKAAALKEDKE